MKIKILGTGCSKCDKEKKFKDSYGRIKYMWYNRKVMN